MLNLWGRTSYNSIIMGETGSGKSFFAKSLLMRFLILGAVDEIYIFDPLGTIIITSEISSSAALWAILLKYGLSQPYAFPYSMSFLSAQAGLFTYLIDELGIPIATITLMACSVRMIISRDSGDARGVFYRIIIAAFLFIFAFNISRYILEISYYGFSLIWGFNGVNWFNAMTTYQIGTYLGEFSGGGNTLAVIFLASGYFSASFFLLTFLMLWIWALV